jgi:hypothetical protein
MNKNLKFHENANQWLKANYKLHGKVLDYKKPEFMLSQEKDF